MSNPTAVVRPSFFKPLINKDYSTTLGVPLAFMRKHWNVLPENVKLRIRSGKIWTVKIEETDDDDEECFFTEGWNNFVKDLALRRPQMLVFWLNAGDGTFDVAVYDSDSTVLEFSAVDFGGRSNVIVVESDSEEDESDSEEGESDESRPRFQFVLTKNQTWRMNLPKAFAADNAVLRGKSCVVLQYPPRDRYWAVDLEQQNSPLNSLDLTAGWHQFVVENKLVLGKNYSFEFNLAKNLILVSDCSSTSDSIDHTRSMNTDHVLKFVREVKEHHLKYYRMTIPQEVVLAMGGMARNGGINMELENSRGRKWPITIVRNTNKGFAMARGLLEFFRGNHVQVGDIFLFEFVPNSILRFEVMKNNEAGKEMLARSGKGGLITT